jgi:hypothetical protein
MIDTKEAPEKEESAADENTEARKLLDSIKSREKFFESGWWKDAERATELYNCEKDDPKNPYNILYSNTEVLKPSLYSATPKPDVRTRFLDSPSTPLTKLVENLLIVFSDTSSPGYESLDLSMGDATSSSLIAGLGFIRLRHYPDRPFPLCTESGHYKGLIWAAGRKWAKLPWIAFRHELTKEELFKQFNISPDGEGDYQPEDSSDDEDKSADKNKSIVYEVWVKEDREVKFLCEDWAPVLLKETPDPMKLEGFYPTPGLLLMTSKPGRIIPTPLYSYYRNQAEELNRVTARLNKVLAAIKVRGAYNSLLGKELAQMLSDDQMENALIPAEESGLLAQNGGFDKQIWLLPIEKLVEVATQLYQARIQIKQVIYEITGLSDIIRGSSIASETATAQNLKNKWGSIRLRDMQKSVASYVRDIYRLVVDASVQLIPPEQWKAITSAPLLTESEKAIAAQQAMYNQMLGRPVDPAVAQSLQQPTIEEILKKISSDASRAYTINVQSDSTIDLDTATDKQEVIEFMNAMGQVMAGLQPLASLGPTGLEAAKAILIATCQRFKFGLGIVDSLKAVQQPPPAQTGPTPEQQQKEKDLTAQEAQLKDLLQKLEDAKREIEVQRKEFDADQRIAAANQHAQEQISAANQQVQEQAQRAKAAEETATFVQRKSELKTVTADAKSTQRVAAKTNQEMSPLVQNMAQAIQTMSAGIAELQKAIQEMQKPKGPKTVRKQGDAYIVEG